MLDEVVDFGLRILELVSKILGYVIVPGLTILGYIIVPAAVTWAIGPTSRPKTVIIFLFTMWIINKKTAATTIKVISPETPTKHDDERGDGGGYEFSIKR